MSEKHRKNIFNIIIAGIILVIIGIMAAALLWYQRLSSEHQKLSDEKASRNYQLHCVYITENNEDPFWSSIYTGAREAGEERDIYVENYGESLFLDYTIEEKMDMAIASGVDAIIVEGTKTKSMTGMIEKASDEGIVVVTVYSDNVGSRRQSFIGINNFQLGYSIGTEAYQYLDKGAGQIMVIYEEDEQKSQDNTLLNTGIKKYLDEMKSEAVLNSQMISSSESYDTQEQIRDLLRNEAARPEVLICTNMLQTQCAYQSVVDLNCVGEVNIIGFYMSQTIREAIQKDIIQATLIVDTKQIGLEAVDSIREYYEYGYSSDYTPVNTEIINKENIGRIEMKGSEE